MSRAGPPICVRCGLTMRCLQNDYAVADDAGEVATFWLGDLYGCDKCDAQVVTGFGDSFDDPDLLPRPIADLRFRYSV